MPCEVKRLNCSKSENVRSIEELAEKAEAQQNRNSGFNSRILPWREGCFHVDRHYIAQAMDGHICGWMTVHLNRSSKSNYIFISEISTRRIKDEFYGGVGRSLHDALVADARAEEIDFIYLYALNEDVAAVYAKWGYVILRPEIKHQFFIIGKEPSKAFLDNLMPENPRIYLVKAHEIALRTPKDDDLIRLINTKRRVVIANPDAIKELSGIIDLIYGMEQVEDDMEDEDKTSFSEKRQPLKEFFENIPIPVRGGRKRMTRRLRKFP